MNVNPSVTPAGRPGTLPSPSRPPASANPGAPTATCRIALVGFGAVGDAVARSLCERPRAGLRLTHIVGNDGAGRRAAWMPATVTRVDTAVEVLMADVDVVVDLLEDPRESADIIRAALEAGKSVVTAGRQTMAHDGPELLALARARGCRLRFEAAVGGPVPMVAGLRDGLAGDRLQALVGILNGACNYMLSRMEWTGGVFADALAEAQRLGLAGAEPADDVEGHDAAAKLSVLSGIAFGRQIVVDEIPRQTIAAIEPIDFSYAARLDCTIRPIAYAGRRPGGLAAWVSPALVPRASMLSHLHGSQSILVAQGDAMMHSGFFGVGAGSRAAAVAIVSDLLALAGSEPVGCGWLPVPTRTHLSVPDIEVRRYLRFVVRDRPGIIAELAKSFAAERVSVEAVLQEPPFRRSELPFVVTLDPCRQSALDRALETIAACDFHVKPPLSLPVLDQSVA